MKTEKKISIPSESEQKAAIIKEFAEALEKNCNNSQDVYNLIRAMQDSFLFLEGQRHKFSDDLSFYIRCIQNGLHTQPEHIISLFGDMTDSLFEMLLISGRSSQGLCIINSKEMKDDINTIVDKYNN